MVDRIDTATTDLAHALGRAVRAYRRGQGLTMAEAARRCGASPSWLSGVERGRALPALRLLARLADALGADLVVGLSPSTVQTSRCDKSDDGNVAEFHELFRHDKTMTKP